MRGDFSKLRYSPLDNDQGVLYQQGRVTLDTDLTDAELIALHWRTQAARDVIGARVAAVPANEPDGFDIVSAAVTAGQVHLQVHPGRIWADGVLLYLPADPANPNANIDRIATYFTPPLNTGTITSIGAGVRDAVILELALEELNGFQDPLRLIEPALGGPDTTERIAARYGFRLFRLGAGQDCTSILNAIADGPAGKGRLSVTLDPPVLVAGECPTVEGGGYSGFEHNLYRIEIAAVNSGAPRFKWSQFNGGLVGRGVFQAGTPNRVIISANRSAIVNSNITEFYLEALQYDAARGHWSVVYGAQATLNSQFDLELNASPVFGTFSFGTEPVFFRLWDGIELISGFDNAAPEPLRDGIHLKFDVAGPGATYRPGDYWTFSVRAGEITNDETLIDTQPPAGPILRRVPLAEINWTAAQDTTQGGLIEDCRKRFRPLTNQKVCCSLLVGDGQSSFGDFNSLEEAAIHLPPSGGDLCLLPGIHFANLTLIGRSNIRIHGCPRRTIVLPHFNTPGEPIFHLIDCTGIEISQLDLISFFGTVVLAQSTAFDQLKDLHVHDCRMFARTYAIRMLRAQGVVIARNLIWLFDLAEGRAAIQVRVHKALIERNSLGVWPISFNPPPRDDGGDDPNQPIDPCSDPVAIYGNLTFSINYALFAWVTAVFALPPQPYKAWGGIHLLGGCEEVKLLENKVDGGAGHGITLGGLLPGEPPTAGAEDGGAPPAVVLTQNAFFGLVRNEAGQPVTGIDVYLKTGNTIVGQDTSKGAQAQVDIKADVGAYTLGVETGFEIVTVLLADTAATRVHIIIIRAVAVQIPEEQGFLYQISIRENELLRMALSGIGFRQYATEAPSPTPPNLNDPTAVAGFLATMFAPRQLLGTTNVVRDLTIAENRIHHNLRAVFDVEMRRQARDIGQGGISLGLVENGRITGNQVLDNGTTAVNPTCGIFVGYAENLEIADNEVSGNGPVDANYETDKLEGLRGGIYVRFTSALLVGGESDAQQKPAVRVLDNRIDQPAGRGITIFAFGPVACNGNYVNSERTGRFNILDQVVGGVLIINIGGLHRQMRFTPPATTTGLSTNSFSRAQAAELLLPGGEVLFNSNQLRLGTEHQSITTTLILTLDDVGFDGNQSSVFRPDLLFSNGVCIGFSLRATDNRFREHTATCFFSLVTYSFGMTAAAKLQTMNTTAHNQGDHCIVALSNAPRPPAAAPHGPPVVFQGNMEANFVVCRRLLESVEGQNAFLTQALIASLFGNQGTTGFNRAAISNSSKQAAVAAAGSIQQSQMQYRASYKQEASRLEQQLGADSARVQQAKVQVQRSGAAVNQLSIETELATIKETAAPENGTVFDGRVMDASYRGKENLTVELVRADDSTVGVTARTDAAGYYSMPLDAQRTTALAGEQELFVRVTDAQGNVISRTTEPLKVTTEAPVRSAVTLGTRAVPQDALANATTLYRKSSTITQPGRATPLEAVKGIGPKTATRLRAAGISDVESLLSTPGEKLVDIAGFDAEVVREHARRVLERDKPATPVATGPTWPDEPAAPKETVAPAEAEKPADKANRPRARKKRKDK